MRKFKFILPVIAVLLLAVAGVFAMKAKNETTVKQTTYYYQYSGTSYTLSDYQNAANWSDASTTPQTGCDGDTHPCVVRSSINNKSGFVSSITSTAVVENNVQIYKD